MPTGAIVSLCRTRNRDALFHQLGNAPEQLWAMERQRFARRCPAVGRIIDMMVVGWTMQMKATLASGLSMLGPLPHQETLTGTEVSDVQADAEARQMKGKVAINFTFLLHRLLNTQAEVRQVDLAFGRLHRIIRQNQ